MNKQRAPGGIEWTRVRRWNRMLQCFDAPLPGYTWNPTSGCFHGCTWEMPDGSVAGCYAKTVAERLAVKMYPEGYEHHYWHPERLDAPLEVKKPAGIFVGSMADLFGRWVTHAQINCVLETIREASWHTFMTLTKNPKRLQGYNLPGNLWAGCSIPSQADNARYRFIAYLRHMENATATVRVVSFEPLWFDVLPVLEGWLLRNDVLPFEWAIVGAASNGSRTYQPETAWVNRLLSVLDRQGIPMFMKRNLEWPERREEFPRG